MKKSIWILIAVIVVAVIAYIIWGGSKPSYDMPSNTVSEAAGGTSLSGQVISTTTKMYTLDEISAHPNATSCWSAINDKVYDLTSWISQHPGGEQAILSICGKDGSAAFNSQHSGQQRQADILKGFYIGDLKK